MTSVHAPTSDTPLTPLPRTVSDRPILLRYAVAVVTVLAALLARILIERTTGVASPFLTFIGAVIVSAWFGGLGPGLFATSLGALMAARYMAHPYLLGWIVRLAIYVAEGCAISVAIALLQRALRRSELSTLRARRHHEDLHRAEENFRGLLECAPDALVIVDADGRIVLLNSQAERLFGYARHELLGQPIELLVPTHLRTAHVQWRQAYCSNPVFRPIVVPNLNLRALRKDGDIVPVEISLSPLRSQRGLLVIAAVRDISERRRAAEELRLAKDAAESASRAKDRFLAVLSHELRTPLTPALLTTAALQSSTDLPAEARDELEMVRRNIELEARLIDDLLDLTRIAHGKLVLHFETVDVHRIIDGVIRICERDARDKHLNLQLILRATSTHVRADPARLQQVLWNLLNNAIKFTPAGGTITIRTRHEEYVPTGGGTITATSPPSSPSAETPLPQSTLLVDVIDTGIGIPAESIPKIFAPFEQADASIAQRFGGLGLGLVICKNLMNLHQGAIAASSPGHNQGAVFTITLPTVSPPPAPVPQTSPPETTERRLAILLVEDHPDTLRTMARLLNSANHDVTAVDTVSAALAAAETHEFDLLVSDIGLPDGTGCDLMRDLQSRHPKLNGIALTGYGMEDDIECTRRAGFGAHLTKPIVIAQLLSTIRQFSVAPPRAPAAPGSPGSA